MDLYIANSEPKEPGRDDDQEEGEGSEQGETILVHKNTTIDACAVMTSERQGEDFVRWWF